MISLRPLILKFLGSLLIPLYLLGLIRGLLKNGFNVFKSKVRLMPPPILQDPKWGEHKYVHVSGVKLHYVELGN